MSSENIYMRKHVYSYCLLLVFLALQPIVVVFFTAP